MRKIIKILLLILKARKRIIRNNLLLATKIQMLELDIVMMTKHHIVLQDHVKEEIRDNNILRQNIINMGNYLIEIKSWIIRHDGNQWKS